MLHCYLTVNNQTTWNTMNPRRSRNRFSAFYIESDPETEQSGGSEYLSANEWTEDHLQPKALYKSDSESEELDPLASSTIIKGVEPLEPRPWNITNLIQRLVQSECHGCCLIYGGKGKIDERRKMFLMQEVRTFSQRLSKQGQLRW